MHKIKQKLMQNLNKYIISECILQQKLNQN